MTGEGYFPTITSNTSGTFHVKNSNENIIGELQWNNDWDCYVFIPWEGFKIQLGPAFLANLASQMIKLEAQKRKELTTQLEGLNMRDGHRCKIGTIPAFIYLYRKYKIRVGLKIKYRNYNERNWQTGYVWKVYDDGFFFVAHENVTLNESFMKSHEDPNEKKKV